MVQIVSLKQSLNIKGIGLERYLKYRIIHSLFQLIILTSCIESHNHDGFVTLQDQGDETSIRLLSFNILTTIDVKALSEGYKTWVDRRDSVFGYIKNLNPDIMALQEVSPSQYDQIRELLEKDYDFVDNRGFSPDSILLYKRSRFERLEKGHWILEDPGDAKIRRLAVWVKLEEKNTKKQLMTVGVHLDAKDIKEAESLLLAAKISKNMQNNAPVFLLGDFNSKKDSVTFKNFLDVGLTDWLTEKEELKHFTYPYLEPERRIDHILHYSTRIKLKSPLFEMIPAQIISDHKPVALDFLIEKS